MMTCDIYIHTYIHTYIYIYMYLALWPYQYYLINCKPDGPDADVIQT